MRLSSHVSMQFTHLPQLERPAAARAAGFELIDSWWPDEPDAWAAAVLAAGVGVACVNAYAGEVAAGDRGFLNVPARRERTRAELRAAAALARRIDAGAVNVLVGRALLDLSLDEQWATAVSLLRELAGEGVPIVVEHINERDIPGSVVPTPARAAELVEAVARDNVRLLYDAYHAAAAGLDPVAEVGSFMAVIGHVQYADHPGRGAPGTGTIDYDAFLAALAGAGYRGAVGLEYPDGERGAAGAGR